MLTMAPSNDAQLFLEPALDAFGTSRLVAGSAWPSGHGSTAPTPAAYAFSLDLSIVALSELGVANYDLDAVFAGNARRVYGL